MVVDGLVGGCDLSQRGYPNFVGQSCLNSYFVSKQPLHVFVASTAYFDARSNS